MMFTWLLILILVVGAWVLWDSIIASVQTGSAENEVAKAKVEKVVKKIKKSADKIKREL